MLLSVMRFIHELLARIYGATLSRALTLINELYWPLYRNWALLRMVKGQFSKCGINLPQDVFIISLRNL